MIHFGFLAVFALAVGVVLAAMLRRRRHDVVRLSLWISGTMIVAAVVLAWVLYFLPIG
jgi:uncharacterized membrane protein YoaK (UPF0700 family)